MRRLFEENARPGEYGSESYQQKLDSGVAIRGKGVEAEWLQRVQASLCKQTKWSRNNQVGLYAI
ncbi:MAG: hypothetical protein AAGG48_30110 [Planctomycetota bacterium]